MPVIRIYRNKRFSKQMNSLREAGGKARLAARRVEEIIGELSRDPMPEVRQLTNHGELRLKKALKFDLGAGYRLLAMLRHDLIILLYVGTHDDCDHWLNRNRGFDLAIDLLPPLATPADAPLLSEPAPQPENGGGNEPADSDAHLHEQLDDAMLRRIFKGLCGA